VFAREALSGKKSSSCCLIMSTLYCYRQLFLTAESLLTGLGEQVL
jgi:hypothetical protein